MKSAATASFRIVMLLLAIFSCQGVLIAQTDLQIKRVVRLSPNIRVFYSIRCNGQLELSHSQMQLTLREDGIPITQYIRQCPDTTVTGDISFALALDGSGSTVGAPNRWIKASANAFVEKMEGNDQGAVFHYNAIPTLVQAVTSDSAALKQAIGSLLPAGASATYSAIYQALTHVGLAGSRSRRAVIAVADGADNSSINTPDAVIELSNELHIPVIVIGLGGGAPSTEFQNLTNKTGGRFYAASDSTQLSQAFRDAYEYIADSFEECRLVYVSRCPDGALHNVELLVNSLCGGSDSASGQYRELLDTLNRTPLEFGVPPVEALATETFVIPVYIIAASPAVLHPFEMYLSYYNNCTRFESLSIPPGSPLVGMDLVAVPEGNRLRIRSTAATYISGPGVFFNLHFTAQDRLDSIACSFGLENITYSAGCYVSSGVSNLVHVGVPPRPEITPAGRISLCSGQTLHLTTTKGYDSYLWSTSQTDAAIVVNSNGSYTVTVMDRAGRIATSPPVEVSYRTDPHPRLTEGPAIILCKGDSIPVGVNGVYSNYLWSNNAPTSTIIVKQAGLYYLTVTDDAGCTWNSDTLIVSVADPQVNATANGPLEFCDGGAVTLDAGPGFTAYRWSNNEQTQRITVRSSGNYTVRVSDINGCIVHSDTFKVLVRARPVAAISPSGIPSLCPGDTIILDGGQGYATWQWSTGFGGRYLPVSRPGSYGLRVIDSYGCVSEPDSVVVTLIPKPSLNVSDTVIICPSGRVDLDAGAGYASYLWSNGATSRTIGVSSPGLYFARVSTNGCVLYSDTVVVEQRAQIKPVITLSGPARICEGDSVQLDGGDYVSWHWSTGEVTRYIIVRASGSYVVAVIDEFGCPGSSDPVSITTVPAPVPTITALTPSRVCEGDSVTLAASPDFADYRWSNGGVGMTIVVTSSGAYSVTVMNSDGCSGTSTPTVVTVVPPPAKPIITRNGETLTSSPASSYQWRKDGTPMPGVTGQSYIPVVSGSYAVRVFNANGCFTDSDPLTITITGIDAAPSTRPRELTLHPDPTTGRITVTGESGRVSGIDITITNLLGQVVARYSDRNARGRISHTMNIAPSPNGIYLVQVRLGDRTTVRRIVKQ